MKKCFSPVSSFMCCSFSCFLLCLTVIFSSCTYKVYVVRHAEKSTSPADDPILTPEGSQRAQNLKTVLQNEKISKIYSTQTTRTIKTAEPLAQYLKLSIETYPPKPDTAFIDKVKALHKNQLIVGHSNTVDDLVNMLTGKTLLTDLPETIYNNLFLIKIRRNGSSSFINLKY